MTILPDPLSPTAVENEEALARAAQAAAEVLPSASPLRPSDAAPGNLGSAMGYAGAALASCEGATPGTIAVLVAQDLVAALESSPLGSLDLAAAAQPALDAAAQALGTRVGAARTVQVDLVVTDMGGMFTVVPLVGEAGAAALLVSDGALESASAAAPEPGSMRAAAPQPAATQAAADAGPQSQDPGQPRPVPLGSFEPIDAPTTGAAPIARGLEMLHGVIMDVTVELGRTKLSVRELLALTPGTVLELDRAAGSPADLLVNGQLIARGEVVVVDEDFGLRVTEIVDAAGAS